MATKCHCGKPDGQCVKGDLEWCPDWDEHDEEDEDELSLMEQECGRWNNGGLSPQCSQAGTEWCDWECPIGLPRRRGR